MAASRWLALKAIAAVDRGQLAQAALEATGLTGNGRAFVSDLLYGCLRVRIRLRHILAQALPRPEKLPPDMRIALEMAVYSLLFQDKAPAYAIVNETVKYVKGRFGQRLARVANAALRSLPGEAPPPAGALLAGLALQYAMPEAIAGLWQKAWGRETAIQLMARSFQRPWACLRVNMRKSRSQALLAALCECEGCVRVGNAGAAFPPGKMPTSLLDRDLAHWQKAGLISWQAAGSQLALEELDIYADWQNTPVWDACAGFGGKTLAMLENGLDARLASDTSARRLARLPGECARLALPAPGTVCASAALPPMRAWPGHILADAPCSGLGVLARRPDIKARFAPERLRELERLQAGILAALAHCLLPGRELVYMTCTLNPAENERQVNSLAAAGNAMEIVKTWQTPHDHPWLEGMYACRLVKRGKRAFP